MFNCPKLNTANLLRQSQFVGVAITLCSIFLLNSCGFYQRQIDKNVPLVKVEVQPTENLREGRVENYDSAIDYFPEKSEFARAKQLKVEYGRNYKRIFFRSNTTGEEIRYVLVQRGTPTPDLPELADKTTRLIQIPLSRFAQSGWRYGGAWDLLGVVPKLVAVPTSNILTTPSIRARIESGELRQDMSEEVLLESNSEAVFDVYNGGVQNYIQRKWYEIGLQPVMMAEPLESEPLAKTEWIKFVAMFFNREKIANDYFAKVEADYLNYKAKVDEKLKTTNQRPRVMVNHFNGGTWHIYGEKNTFATLIRDAGGDYHWAEVSKSFAPIERIAYEAAYDRATEADVWIVGPDFSSRFANGDPLFDERIGKLPIARSGRFFVSYNPDANGRNPYWDQALINPHLELADYIKAIHPDLLPEHKFVFLRNLQAKN